MICFSESSCTSTEYCYRRNIDLITVDFFERLIVIFNHHQYVYDLFFFFYINNQTFYIECTSQIIPIILIQSTNCWTVHDSRGVVILENNDYLSENARCITGHKCLSSISWHLITLLWPSSGANVPMPFQQIQHEIMTSNFVFDVRG